MKFHVLAKRARVCIAFVASLILAVVWFVGRMDMRMLFSIAGVGEAAIATRELAYKWLFACVSSFVDL